MNAPKHTPGPWGYTIPDRVVDFVRPGRIPRGICLMNPAPAEGDTDANGTLIAAAPEMLEALKASNRALITERDVLFDSVRNNAGEVDDPRDGELVAEFDALIAANKAAIAKAEGAG